jgi:hypothetical protein
MEKVPPPVVAVADAQPQHFIGRIWHGILMAVQEPELLQELPQGLYF